MIRSGYSFDAVEVKVQKYNTTLIKFRLRSLGKPVTSFVFLRVLMFPSTKHQDSREDKAVSFGILTV